MSMLVSLFFSFLFKLIGPCHRSTSENKYIAFNNCRRQQIIKALLCHLVRLSHVPRKSPGLKQTGVSWDTLKSNNETSFISDQFRFVCGTHNCVRGKSLFPCYHVVLYISKNASSEIINIRLPNLRPLNATDR